MDGRLVDSLEQYCAESTGFCDGVYETEGRKRPFIFARLTTRAFAGNPRSRVPYSDLGRAVPEIGAMHEKNKKAGVHAVSFGDLEELGESDGLFKWTKVEKEPFATFTFCYRPLELLKANSIVPLRSSPPLPSQSLKGKKRASDSQASGSDASQHDQKRVRVEAIKSEDAPKVEHADDDTHFSAAEDVNSLEAQLVLLQKRIADAKAAQRAGTTFKRETSPIRVHPSSSSEVIDLT
ncbi:hypothetical protein VTO73DRAFT_12582 [Trametes versicolor]